MARKEENREDLLSEATALAERIGIRVAGHAETALIGFRRDGSASFFLDPQRVYQFNSAGHLRRAFVDDLLYKAERGKLVALRRHRTANAVELLRRELTCQESEAFLADMGQHLGALDDVLAGGQYELLDEIPPGSDLTARIRQCLALLAGRPGVATSPRAG